MANDNRLSSVTLYNVTTIVWRGSINYHLAELLDSIDAICERYNALITKNGYDVKYHLPSAKMFIIEGMERVKSVIEKTDSESYQSTNSCQTIA